MPATPNLPAEVVSLALELKDEAMAPGAGAGSSLPYVLNLRKDIEKRMARPYQQIAAVVFDDVVNKGRSAAEATAWTDTLRARADLWQDQRDGLRLGTPDPSPLVLRENRFEDAENVCEDRWMLAKDTDAEADALAALIAAGEREIDATQLRNASLRDRLAVLRSSYVGAR